MFTRAWVARGFFAAINHGMFAETTVAARAPPIYTAARRPNIWRICATAGDDTGRVVARRWTCHSRKFLSGVQTPSK